MIYRDEIVEIIEKIAPFKLDKQDIKSETSLSDMGIDSILFIRLLIELEDFFDITFPDEFLCVSGPYTLDALCKAVSNIVLRKENENGQMQTGI